jgi:hypothetical protein
MRAFRFFGYSGKVFLYQRWLERALGAKFAKVHKTKIKPGKDQVIIAQPSHSIISPK